MARSSPLASFQQALLAEARALTPGPPPPPWTAAPHVVAGGILAGGWTSDGHIVLISSAGYSVIDPTTGARVIRNRDPETTFAAFAPDPLTFVEPETGEHVRVFGVWGGDGVHVTSDGWELEVIYPWWPEVDVLLRPPRGPGMHGFLEGAYLLDGLVGVTWRGCGFAPSGDCFMLLASDGPIVYLR